MSEAVVVGRKSASEELHGQLQNTREATRSYNVDTGEPT